MNLRDLQRMRDEGDLGRFDLAPLTRRELELLDLFWGGQSTRGIADAYSVTLTRVRQIMLRGARKLKPPAPPRPMMFSEPCRLGKFIGPLRKRASSYVHTDGPSPLKPGDEAWWIRNYGGKVGVEMTPCRIVRINERACFNCETEGWLRSEFATVEITLKSTGQASIRSAPLKDLKPWSWREVWDGANLE